MFVITRRYREEIVIQTSDGPIIVKFLGCKGRGGIIGIEAPKTVKIERKEVLAGKPREGER